MLRIIICLIPILLLSSCNEKNNFESNFCEQGKKPLIIFNGDKSMYSYPKNNPSHVLATGIWQIISNHDNTLFSSSHSINNPHAVQISCDKNVGACSIQEIMMGSFTSSEAYYIRTNTEEFHLKTWNQDKIIATNDFRGSCFLQTLQINLHTEEVYLKAMITRDRLNDKFCSHFKGQSMPVVYKLVDESESFWDYSIILIKKQSQ